MNSETRRKRKRKPTSGGRFQGSLLAYEIGLVRLALEAQKEFIANDVKNRKENKDKN